jgi:hypothetical protein
MKRVGAAYLRSTLQAVFGELMAANPSCEIDPARIPKGETLDANLSTLQYFFNKLVIAVFSSASTCPAPMRRLFAQIKRCAGEKFPDSSLVANMAVSAFLFLRFFAPAIQVFRRWWVLIPCFHNIFSYQSPESFGILHVAPSCNVKRAATLMSKIFQTLGNLGRKRFFFFLFTYVVVVD